MVVNNLELLIPSLFALLCTLYPAPWHVRNRNTATLAMIAWMTALSLTHIINSIAWCDNVDVKAEAWGDISVIVGLGYNYGLPLSHLILAKQLESCTSLRSDSLLYDESSSRRQRVFDICLAIFGPLIGYLVSLSCRSSRFNVVEKYGPLPGIYWDTWGIVWVAIVPILIAMLCFGFTAKACYNIIRRRQQMRTIMSKNATVDRSHFWRLMILANAELGTCMIRAVFNMMAGTHGMDALRNGSELTRSFTNIRQIPLAQYSQDPNALMVYRLSWFTVVACSFVFFLCFATSSETKRFYWSVLARIFPCLPLSRDMGLDDIQLKESYQTESDAAKSGQAGIASEDKEVSLLGFLDSPASPRSARIPPSSPLFGPRPPVPILTKSGAVGTTSEDREVSLLGFLESSTSPRSARAPPGSPLFAPPILAKSHDQSRDASAV